MNCPHCCSTHTTQLQRTTDLGYGVFRCKQCWRTFNKRTSTPFNFLKVPTDIVFQVLLCRLRYKLSFRDIVEFFLVRGFEFTEETVRNWEERFATIFAQQLRAKRKGKVGKIWCVDERAPYVSCPIHCLWYYCSLNNSAGLNCFIIV